MLRQKGKGYIGWIWTAGERLAESSLVGIENDYSQKFEVLFRSLIQYTENDSSQNAKAPIPYTR